MRYLTLDGLRGIAALAVVVFHADVIAGAQYAPLGFRAVDLFFLLSGFVIAHAYDARLPAMGAAEFVRRRVIRFYPLYLLGMCLGGAWLAAELIISPPATLTAEEGLRAFLLSLFFLPGSPQADFYPLNVPAWTLACELLVNILFAVFHRWLTLGRLWIVVALSGLPLVAAGVGSGVDGLAGKFAVMALARAFFGFSLGVIIYRTGFRWRAHPLLLAVLVAAALFAPVPQAWRGAYGLACIMVLFPLLVAGGTAQPRRGRLCAWAGDASYTIYAVHYPLIWMVAAVVPPPWAAAVFFAGLLAVIAPLQRFYDRPLRKWALEATQSRPPATVTEPPAG